MNKKLRLIFLLTLVLGILSVQYSVFAVGTENITLESQLLKVTFKKENGQPELFTLLPEGETFWGEENGNSIRTVVRRLSDKKESMTYAILQSHTSEENSIIFSYAMYYDNNQVGTFDMRYRIDKRTVYISYDNIEENEGYHLIEIAPRSLVTIREEDGESSFVYNTPAGRLVKLSEASTGVLGDDGRFSGVPNASVMPVTAFIKPNVVCTMEVFGYVSNVGLDVTEKNNNKRATMGISVQNYIRGGDDTPDLPVDQKEICRIDFATDYDENGTVNWIDAANIIKSYMPTNPTDYFEDKFVYVLKGEMGRRHASCTFDQAETLTRKVNSLLDNNPQVMYIAGWAEGGHDTAYPNYTQINESLGGEDGFFNLKNNGKTLYNATISFDDNFDDQYDNKYSEGFFNPAYIARTQDGNLEKHKAWNLIDKSHITGMAKYMVPGGQGETRIDYTASHYQLEGTKLIDALSWWSIRHDWDPNNPASAVKNLREGKFKVIERYKNQHNIDIASELLRYPFIGRLGLVLDGMYERATSYGGAGYDIPFTSLVLRNSIIYGGSGGMNSDYNDPKSVLFDNTRRHPWLFDNTSNAQVTDLYYLNYVPWFQLHSLDILKFQRNNNVVDMILSNNSKIHIDYNNNTWYADYEGNRVWTNNNVTCPMSGDRIAFYSKNGDTLSYPIPAGVDAANITAKVLYSDRHDNYPFKIENDNIIVDVPAQRPVIIYTKEKAETYYTINDDNGTIRYNDNWEDFNNRPSGDFNNDVHGTKSNGASSEYTFEGTGIQVFSEKNNDMGEVDIYIDGEFMKTVNCYYPTRLHQQVIYNNQDIAQGKHTIKVVKRSGEWCLVDGYRVFNVPIKDSNALVNDDAPGFKYTGNWINFDKRGALDYNDDIMGTRTNGDFAEFTFIGKGVELLTETYKDQGDVDIYIDGQYMQTINCNSSSRQYQQVVYGKYDLPYGQHTIKIVKKNAEWMLIDALRLL